VQISCGDVRVLKSWTLVDGRQSYCSNKKSGIFDSQCSNEHDHVYGAELLPDAPDYFDECRTAPGGRRPLDQANPLGELVCSVHIHTSSLFYYYEVEIDSHFTVPRSLEG